MTDFYIIDECINDYEFRGFVIWYLINHGYSFKSVDDELLKDEDKNNDNDIIVVKENVKYTVQVYLNKPIDISKIEETSKDIIDEGIYDGIIFTNLDVSVDNIKQAVERNITILDRNYLKNDYNTYKNEVK